MKQILMFIVMSLPFVAPAQAIDTRTQIFDGNFKSLQVKLSGNDYFPPVLMMGSDKTIEIRFDELSPELSYLRYSVIHCNADWQPSALVDTEYLEGFNYANIEDYEYSSGTFTNYVHYKFSLPNEDISFTKSGNYLVQVYREQIDITIDTKEYRVRDMYQDLMVFVNQNSRIDNEAFVNKPLRVMGNKAVFEHDRNLIFPAGNEFRRMEIVAVSYPTMRVAQMEYFDPYYHATLYTDEPRTEEMYLYDKTQNGRFTIRNAETEDSDSRADYIVTHFSLATDGKLTGGKIYIDGEFTNHLFTPSTLMNYDPYSGCYIADILLKQGAYNYQYLFVPDGTNVGLTSTIEGDKYQTVNEYSVRVYNRQQGERYDRMIGFGMIFSGR